MRALVIDSDGARVEAGGVGMRYMNRIEITDLWINETKICHVEGKRCETPSCVEFGCWLVRGRLK